MDAMKQFLFGGGTSVKFPKIGYEVTGTIIDLRMAQQRDYDTGELAVWKDGNPRMQLVITLATDERGSWDKEGNPIEVPGDDGERSLFVKGGMSKALAMALKAAQAELPEIGGKLTVKRGKNGPQPNPKFNAPKTYTCVYVPAAQNPDAMKAAIAADGEGDPFA